MKKRIVLILTLMLTIATSSIGVNAAEKILHF